jgi:hypothetical protein
MNEPMIFTTLGNVPVASLEHRPHWEDTPTAIVFVDEYFLDGQSVKRGVNVLSKHGITGEAVANQL